MREYHATYKKVGFRTAVVDIETSSLEAVGAGFMLCIAVKPLGEKPKVLRYDRLGCRPAHEAKLVRGALKELYQCDMIIGHNIQRFDWNYIKSRALCLGIPVQKNPLIYDTFTAFRRLGFLTRQNGFGKPSASLAMVADFLGIPQQKTGIYPREHWKAVWESGLHRTVALNHIANHCVADVSMNELVFYRLFEQDSNVIIKRAR